MKSLLAVNIIPLPCFITHLNFIKSLEKSHFLLAIAVMAMKFVENLCNPCFVLNFNESLRPLRAEFTS
jgi:hypothetical protein